MTKNVPAHWKKIRSEAGPDFVIMKARHDYLEHPRSHQVMKRVVFESTDWVNVVALTEDEQLVLVRQFRFGVEKVTLEVPGGMVDPGEDHFEAARRELLEETGFASEDWHYLGYVEPNPAILDNHCHTWLARKAFRQQEPNPEAGEDITVEVLGKDAVKQAYRDGAFRHSLAVIAVLHVLELW
ncbi:MAG TPA: NUDIX hydrolase [Calditrichia bacterium]|nr:NUDIX hydrolase [Calditrichota bacterium]HQV32976.1 NUDIX hydrolase [Calditrichia bacterium]